MIHNGDCLEVMARMEPESVDAIVCDPPYGLGFMGKEWDDLPPGQDWAEQCLRVLKPGGHLLAFGGTRTYHRLAVAVEDAGFEIRDQIMWLYGSGFPKSHDVSKGIDKAAGAEGAYGEPKSAAHAGWVDRGRMRADEGHEGYQRPWMKDPEAVDKAARKYEPATAEAAVWEGWGTALKPAHEPIVVARKPFKGTVAQNVLEHGTGAINVDGCRVGTEETLGRAKGGWGNKAVGADNYGNSNSVGVTVEGGRWPANLILDPEAGAMLDAQSGESSGRPSKATMAGEQSGSGRPGMFVGSLATTGYEDTGGASRFFYCAKSSSAERNAGLDGFEAKPHRRYGEQGQGPSPQQTPRREQVAANVHPTVKPIEVMRWLVRLVTPPGGTVLDPFTGSGTTGIAAHLEGMEFIGIERESEYHAIAEARIEWWSKRAGNTAEILAREGLAEKATAKHTEAGQLGLLGDAA